MGTDKMNLITIVALLAANAAAMLASMSRLRTSGLRPNIGSNRYAFNRALIRQFHASPRLAYDTSPEDQAAHVRAIRQFYSDFHDRQEKEYLEGEKNSLATAYEFGDQETLTRLLHDPNYKVVDDDVWAAFGGTLSWEPDYTLLRQLFIRGGSPNALRKWTDTWTILGWAAYQGNIRLVRFLISYRVTASLSVNEKGQVAADLAREKGHMSIVFLLEDYTRSYLQDTKAEPSLLDAIKFGDVRTTKYLLARRQFSVEDRDSRGNDALWIAAGYPAGRLPEYDLMKKLIRDHGFMPTFNDRSEANHLVLWASFRRDPELMSIVAPFVTSDDRGKFVEVNSILGWFHRIARTDIDGPVKLSLSKMYNLRPREYQAVHVSPEELALIDENGNDALWRACGHPLGQKPEYARVSTLLHKHKMNPDRPNNQSPLSNLLAWAIYSNDLELVLLLTWIGECDLNARVTAKGIEFLEERTVDDAVCQAMLNSRFSWRQAGIPKPAFSMLDYSDSKAMTAYNSRHNE